MTVWDEFCGDIKAGKEVARYQGRTKEASAYQGANPEIDLTDSNANLMSFGWSHIASNSEQIKRAMFDVVGYALAQVNDETDATKKQEKMKNLCANVKKAQELLNGVYKTTEAGMAQEMLQGLQELQELQQGTEQGKSNTDEGEIEFDQNSGEPQTDTKTAQGRQSENHTEEVSPLQEILAKFKRLAEVFLQFVSQLFGVSQPGQNQTNSENQVDLNNQKSLEGQGTPKDNEKQTTQGATIESQEQQVSQEQQTTPAPEGQQDASQGQNTQQGTEQQNPPQPTETSPQTEQSVAKPNVTANLAVASAAAVVSTIVNPVVGQVVGEGVKKGIELLSLNKDKGK